MMTERKPAYAVWRHALLLALALLAWSHTAQAAQNARPSRHDGGCVMAAGLPDRAQAVLTDATQLARICAQRPQRLSPAPQYGGSTVRTLPRIHHLFHLQRVSFSHYRGAGYALSAPVTALPACRYYVYMLGHMLC